MNTIDNSSYCRIFRRRKHATSISELSSIDTYQMLAQPRVDSLQYRTGTSSQVSAIQTFKIQKYRSVTIISGSNYFSLYINIYIHVFTVIRLYECHTDACHNYLPITKKKESGTSFSFLTSQLFTMVVPQTKTDEISISQDLTNLCLLKYS